MMRSSTPTAFNARSAGPCMEMPTPSTDHSGLISTISASMTPRRRRQRHAGDTAAADEQFSGFGHAAVTPPGPIRSSRTMRGP
jgi:hypothetical protein